MTADILLLLNVAATLFMTGLIWFVQIVHYPLFAEVERENYGTYQDRHQKLTSFVVGPPMLIEAFTAVLLIWFQPEGVDLWILFTGIALIFLIWTATAALSVPCHGKLLEGFDAAIHRRLVVTNWPRTIGWTARGALMCYAMWQWAQ